MKVSIITPSFNQGCFLRKTISSVIEQGEWLGDYVIIDGRSTDETSNILNEYRRHCKIKKIVSEPDHGQADALNKGLGYVADPIMGYVNSDDVLERGALRYVSAFFGEHPEVDVLCGARCVIGTLGWPVCRALPMLHAGDEFYRSMDFFQEATFWRRGAFEAAGGYFDDKFRFAMDFELFCRMNAAGATFRTTNRTLGRFRVHGSSKTSSVFWSTGFDELRKIWRTYGLADMTKQEYSTWCETKRRAQNPLTWPARKVVAGLARRLVSRV